MVSDFIDVTSKPELSPDIEFKIWARSSFRNQTAYAADIGPKILNDFAFKYFNVPFPLPKQDMAAIPDFAAGKALKIFSYKKVTRTQYVWNVLCCCVTVTTLDFHHFIIGAMENWGLVTYR